MVAVSVPNRDEANYRDWQRRAQWKRSANQSAIDRAGAPCFNKPSCPCPICSEYGKMRELAHRYHYMRKFDWPEAWRLAGWDGGAETPFMTPAEKSPVVIPSKPAEPNGWVTARFSEIDCLPSQEGPIESACKTSTPVPALDFDLTGGNTDDEPV